MKSLSTQMLWFFKYLTILNYTLKSLKCQENFAFFQHFSAKNTLEF